VAICFTSVNIDSDFFLYFEDLREGSRAHTYTCTDIHMTAACHFCMYKPVTAYAVHIHKSERARVCAQKVVCLFVLVRVHLEVFNSLGGFFFK
jgi:hypothetical protein